MVTTERCELTELLPAECACRKHRGGQTVDEQARDQRTDRGWFEAQYVGKCVGCDEPFPPGTRIRYSERHQGYLAECCAEEADSG